MRVAPRSHGFATTPGQGCLRPDIPPLSCRPKEPGWQVSTGAAPAAEKTGAIDWGAMSMDCIEVVELSLIHI